MAISIARELHELGNGLFAYVQGDGGWGWSNSGLIVADGKSLMVDTLFTGALTRDMLRSYRAAVPEAEKIDILVNSHANGDHTFGNHLVEGARIVGTVACVEEMEVRPAPDFARMMRDWRDQGDIGAFMHEVMGNFDFSDIEHTPPTDTFTQRRTINLGSRRVELHEVGPAHTRGDILVHVPDARTVFTGDIVFNNAHPIVWAGPVDNWIAACDLILSWDVESVVPGHGPVGDNRAVRGMRDYLAYVLFEATERFNAGMAWDEAAWDIALDGFEGWIDAERIVANVANVYRYASGGQINPSRDQIMKLMLRHHRGEPCPHNGGCGCARRTVVS